MAARKIRSQSELLDFIDSEIAWRRKEIIDIKSVSWDKRDTLYCRSLSKALVLISYSHWEGFVKSASMAFLQYLKVMSFPREQLSERIIAPLILQLGGQSKHKDKVILLNDILCDSTKKISINISRLVDAESNLNFDVLEKIMHNIGMDAYHFNIHKSFIDVILLGTRNSIAHGEREFVEYDRSMTIADTVIGMISQYKTVMENMIRTQEYLKITSL
jgi:hypothetical protein